MHDRHENYEKMGDAMKVINRELKGAKPDLAAVRSNARIIAKFAPQIPGWFPPGTGPDVGKTEAKAAIWQKPEDFMAKSTAFTAAARAFNKTPRPISTHPRAHGTMGKNLKGLPQLSREAH